MKRTKVHLILAVSTLVLSQAVTVEAAVPKMELVRTAENGTDVDVEEEVKVQPMYRLYNSGTKEHFYTSSANERDVLKTRGWKYEGVGWYAPEKSKTPVYRLYNKTLRDHHYTTSENERDTLVKKYGWTYEGIGWYSDDAKEIPLYRRYCPLLVTGAHHYTSSRAEAEYLVTVGWVDEGIAWYGMNPDRGNKEKEPTATPKPTATTAPTATAVPTVTTAPTATAVPTVTTVPTPTTDPGAIDVPVPTVTTAPAATTQPTTTTAPTVTTVPTVTAAPGFTYDRGEDLAKSSPADYAQMVIDNHKDFPDLKLETGAIADNTGANRKSSRALRSAELLDLDGLVVLLNAKPEKYWIDIYSYKKNGEFIAHSTKTKAMSTYKATSTYKYRLAIYPVDSTVEWDAEEAAETLKAAYADSFRDQLQVPAEGMKSLAHMGYYANDAFHMNTLEAFRWAWVLGYDGSEMDVNVSADGVPFICHDPKKTDVNKQEHVLTQMTWAEIQNTVFWADGTRVPSLDEALEQAEECGYTVLLDLKDSVSRAKAAEIAKKVSSSDYLKNHCILATTNLAKLADIRKVSPDLPVLVQLKEPIALDELRNGTTDNARSMKKLLAQSGSTILALRPEKCADEAYYEALREMGFELILTDTTKSGDLEHFEKYCAYYCSFNAGTASYGLDVERKRKEEAEITPGFSYNRGADVRDNIGANVAGRVEEKHDSFVDLKLQKGSISFETGKNQNSNTALRSSEYLDLNGPVVVLNSEPAKYRVRICIYNPDGSFRKFTDPAKASTVAFRPVADADCLYRFAILPASADAAWNAAEAQSAVKVAYVDSFTEPLQKPVDGIKSLAHMGYYANDTFHMNTLEAYRWAWILGYDGSEMDVSVSKDGVPFMSHSEQKSDANGVMHNLSEMTWEEIQNTTFWKDGTKIPSLDEALAQAEDCGYIAFLDLKKTVSQEKAVEIAEKINASDYLKNHVILASDKINTLTAIRQAAPEVPLLYQAASPIALKNLREGSGTFKVLRELAKTSPMILAVNPEKRSDDAYFEGLKGLGFDIILTETTKKGDVEHFRKYCDYFCSFNAGTVRDILSY